MHSFAPQPKGHQDLGRRPIPVTKEPQQQMLGAHGVMTQAAGLVDGLRNYLPGLWSLRQLSQDRVGGAWPNGLRDGPACLGQIDTEVLQDIGSPPKPFLDQPEEEVFRTHVIVV